MSRETDTPSSGPDGRGGAAYPSGTPPYGTPVAPGAGADAGRPSGRPEERKTETTLTTRIRINIPGSRPIPPVVVRKPVATGEGAADDAGAGAPPAPAAGTPAGTGSAEPSAESVPQAEEKASDWFAPRRSGPAKSGQAGGGTNGAGMSAGSAGTGAVAARPAAPGASGNRPGGVVGSMGAPGSRPGSTNGSGLSGATGGPVAPGHGGGTGSFDVTEALAAGPLGGGSRPGAAGGGEPGRDGLPYFSDGGGQDDFGGGAGAGAGAGGPGGFSGPGSPGGRGPQGPTGPTGGPVTGDGPLAPPAARTGGQGGPGPERGEPFGDLTGPTGPAGPGGYGGPADQVGPGGALTVPGGGLSDDTAVLTPQKQAPEPGTPGYRSPDNVSGHTVTSGIPVVPAGGTPFGSAGPAGPAAPPKGAAKPKKKGRSKLVLLCVGVVVVAGGAYGAGLLMNRTDVPKGTTVLGLDIGGSTRDDAVEKLDDAFGSRVDKPLKLSVGGRTVSLAPDNAGLQFDFQATVAEAAKSDYNPVSVIGSLFGRKRAVEPVMPVDEEKLQAALQQAGGGSGAVTEGGITFEPGRAVAVHGRTGRGVDVARSARTVARAYRMLVETDTAVPVTVPTTTRRPTVSDAEVDREMKAFAEPAMSANVTVQTDAAHSVPMSPQKSLWKFLRVVPVGGKLVDRPDLTALKALYGQAFDGVLITRANGQKTAVTPEDVYGALRQALVSRTDRVAVIETDPS
ncbi:hypothetical protein QQY24_10780 [Streptomyces sp. TG1A-8]|uniref:hypothetical protein n=1 Tax=Streptomyces sp. TG1A-8 TaxID=3051385 RepID=UPI00265BF2E1|nr:hypothetical protein [Streptomyces sp. TG1A-8]MDO0925881.1 hypothetical protein [Streptomyces sp. TG1A-8]